MMRLFTLKRVHSYNLQIQTLLRNLKGSFSFSQKLLECLKLNS